MKLLSPHRISGELLDLIHSAREYLILVSPYVRLQGWAALTAALTTARDRGVRIDCFVRLEPENAPSWEQLEALGLRVRLIPNLHAKLYFSERTGLISSLNLLASSNASSIETGCLCESEAELEELRHFVKHYVRPNESQERPSDDQLWLSKERFPAVLETTVRQQTGRKCNVRFSREGLEMQAGGNRYTLSIDKVSNKLSVGVVLSGLEADEFATAQSHTVAAPLMKRPEWHYRLISGGIKHYDRVIATYEPRLSNASFDFLRVAEKRAILDGIALFVQRITEFKRDVYKRSRQAKQPAVQVPAAAQDASSSAIS
jgi:PLD-like domain